MSRFILPKTDLPYLRSLPEVMELALNNELDVICWQETGLRKCDEAIIEEIKSYNYEVLTERKPRKCDVGGGVAILYKKNLPIKKMKYNKYSSFESVSIVIGSGTNQTVVSNLYFPGYSPKHRFTHNAFLNHLEELIETDLCVEENIIVSDFNIHAEDMTRDETIKLQNLLVGQNILPHNTAATHNLGGTIDLLIYSCNLSQKIFLSCFHLNLVCKHLSSRVSLSTP